MSSESVEKSFQEQVIASVTYVGLYYDDISVDWDFGDFHWPEVGVEFGMENGQTFFAIWDSNQTNYTLLFKEGSISEEWHDENARNWNVTYHNRWMPLIGKQILDCSPVKLADEDAAVGLRISFESGTVWIAAASPRDHLEPRSESPRDVVIGDDEVMVFFGDECAKRIGLAPAP